jgi:NAD(P) transhydrogenase subunit alpha
LNKPINDKGTGTAMTLVIGIPDESAAGEKRIAMVPEVAGKLIAAGAQLQLQAGAGAAAGIPESAWPAVDFLADPEQLWSGADLVLAVRPPDPDQIARMREGASLVGFLAPWDGGDRVRALRDRGLSAFAMELVPRISRAQSMDALSSQASVAGYKSVLIATEHLRRFLPMLTTAAGTIRPARVLVIGAGVAGLQAIATARRLGARIEAFDVRTAVAEQVESLGAKFIDTGVRAEGEGGYARELTDEEKSQQSDKLAEHIARADIVITTAAIPGRSAPRIVSREMVEGMKAGAVLVDLAAETGGNCELTRAGENVAHGEVMVCGPRNVPGMLAEHASEMYARNLFNFVKPCLNEGRLAWDFDDEVYASSAVTHGGELRYGPAKEKLEEGGK